MGLSEFAVITKNSFVNFEDELNFICVVRGATVISIAMLYMVAARAKIER